MPLFYEWNHHFHYASWHLLFPTKEPTPAIRPVVPSEPKAGDKTNDFTGFANGESAIGRGIRNFLFGKKKDEKPEQHEKRVDRTKEKSTSCLILRLAVSIS